MYFKENSTHILIRMGVHSSRNWVIVSISAFVLEWLGFNSFEASVYHYCLTVINMREYVFGFRLKIIS